MTDKQDRTCPLGEDCDLTVAWMSGRADADRALAAERDALKARAEAARQDAMLRPSEMRMCVNCGRKTGVDHNRHMPLPDCPSPDACTFDLTPDEAWQHWRQKAHDERARAEAAEAEVARLRDINARLCDWIEHEAGCDLPFDARAALQEPRP